MSHLYVNQFGELCFDQPSSAGYMTKFIVTGIKKELGHLLFN